MRVAWVLLVPAVLLVEPEPAEACSCGPTPQTFPADGAVDVPRNVEVVVFGLDVRTDYVLRGPASDIALSVEEVVTRGERVSVLRPAVVLDPGTAYTLEIPDVYEVATFTTSDVEDVVAPAAPAVGTFVLATAELGDALSYSCGNELNEVQLPVTLFEDGVLVDITIAWNGWQQHVIVRPDQLPRIADWDSACSLSIAVVGGEMHVVSVRARDLAGNLSAAVTRSAVAETCPTIPDPDCAELREGLAGCADGYDGCPAPSADGGCSTSSGADLGFVLLLLPLARRRRPER